MENIQIKKENALKAYNSASSDVKSVLEALLGKENLVPANIMDRVKSFEDACIVLGVSASDIIFSQDSNDEAAYKKIKVIIKALNEGWTPDWANDNEWKYYPWFDMSSGSGLACSVCGNQDSGSNVGSRLCLKSRELAEYAGRQFLDIYKDYFIY
jgi:hypothetical protein